MMKRIGILMAVFLSLFLWVPGLALAVQVSDDSASETTSSTAESTNEATASVTTTTGTSTSASNETSSDLPTEAMTSAEESEPVETAPEPIPLPEPLTISVDLPAKDLAKQVKAQVKKQGKTHGELVIQQLPEITTSGEYPVTVIEKIGAQQKEYLLTVRAAGITVYLKKDKPVIHLGQQAADIDAQQFIEKVIVDNGFQQNAYWPEHFEDYGIKATISTPEDELLSGWIKKLDMPDFNNKNPFQLKIHVESNYAGIECQGESEPFTVGVDWGTSIAFGSYDLGGNGRTSAAFTIHPKGNDKSKLSMSSGIDLPDKQPGYEESDPDKPIHDQFPGERYFALYYHQLESSDGDMALVDDFPQEKAGLVASVNGDEYKSDFIPAFKKNYPEGYEVATGDVLQAWTTEKDKSWLLRGYEGLTKEERYIITGAKHSIYYEVTGDHDLRTLNVNLLNFKKDLHYLSYAEIRQTHPIENGVDPNKEETINKRKLLSMFQLNAMEQQEFKAGTMQLTDDDYNDVVEQLKKMKVSDSLQTITVRIREKLLGLEKSVYCDYQIPVTIVDDKPPQALVNRVIWQQGKPLPRESEAVKKTFFSNITDQGAEDNETIKAKYVTDPTDITEKIGRKDLEIDLIDREGDSRRFRVPLFVVPNQKDEYMISGDDLISLTVDEVAGKDQAALKKLIYQKGQIKGWHVPSGSDISDRLRIQQDVPTTVGNHSVCIELADHSDVTKDVTVSIQDPVDLDLLIPKEMLFGATNISDDTKGENVSSPIYRITNQSKKKAVMISLEKTEVVKTDDITLIPRDQEPEVKGELALKLETRPEHGNTWQELSVSDHYPETQAIGHLQNENSLQMQFKGTYYRNFNEKKKIDLRLRLKFQLTDPT